MEKIVLGNVISSYRDKYELLQNVIREGVCRKTDYLRVEYEERQLEFIVQEYLLARVGVDAFDFEVVLGDPEFEQWSLRVAVREDLAQSRYEELEKKIRIYRAAYAESHILHEQFCQYYEMKLAEWREESEEQLCQRASNALAITKDIEKCLEIKDNLYTHMELDLVLSLIHYHHPIWQNPWKTGAYLQELIAYVRNYFTAENQEEIEGRVWLELVHLGKDMFKEEYLLEYIENAIKCYMGGKRILRLAKVRFMKAKLLHRISFTAENREEKLKLCKEECELAHCIYDVMGREKEREEIEIFCEEQLKWHITTQTE